MPEASEDLEQCQGWTTNIVSSGIDVTATFLCRGMNRLIAYKRCPMLPIYISDSFSAVATDIIGSVSERCRRISHDMAREGIWKEYSTLAKSLPLESGGLHQFVPGKSKARVRVMQMPKSPCQQPVIVNVNHKNITNHVTQSPRAVP